MSALPAGTRLGPYEIVSALGAGGMGEVYRARDTKLDRDVALKILPESFASDPDRLMRFEREAKTLASLNHPNIAAIYGIEDRAIVMELVEGRDLSEVNVPLDEALPIARQIAEALEAAQEAGIIHRDLKPANIKVRDDGTVKVLDFGLAKALSTEHGAPGTAPGAPSTEHSAVTVTSPALTAIGLILGTAAYMSPEQAKGRPVDRRADVWAFGCVLYEMLTGRRAFGGASVTETIAAVIKDPPDFTALPADTPPMVRRLLVRCLEKDPRKRLDSMHVVTLDLAEAVEGTEPEAVPVGRPSTWKVVGALALVAAAVAAATWVAKPAPESANAVLRFDVTVPDDVTELQISPDGSQVAWIARDATRTRARIFLRRLDESRIRVLDTRVDGTDLAPPLAFSPRGDRLAFATRRSGSVPPVYEIRTMSLSGERAELVGTVATEILTSLAWGPGTIFASAFEGRIVAFDESGGSPRTVVEPREGDVPSFRRLTVLNEGGDLLFMARRDGETGPGLWTVPAAGGDPRRVMEGAWNYVVAASGHLVHGDGDGVLYARRFLADRVEAVGSSVPIIDPAASHYRVSTTGTLVSANSTVRGTEFVWTSRDGADEVIPDLPTTALNVSVSHSGRYLLFNTFRADGARGQEVWVRDLQDGGRVRISARPGVNIGRWIPGTDAVVLTSTSTEDPAVMRAEPPWLAPPAPIGTVSGSVRAVSPDGRQTLTIVDEQLVLVSVDGTGAPTPIEPHATGSVRAAFSPDGRWLVYGFGVEGQSDVWMRPYPDVAAGRWRLGPGRGDAIFWRADGGELFYYSEDRWVSRTVRAGAPGAAPDLGPVVPLDVPAAVSLYGVTPDGRRFLATRPLEVKETAISFVVNFFEELRAKVPK